MLFRLPPAHSPLNTPGECSGGWKKLIWMLSKQKKRKLKEKQFFICAMEEKGTSKVNKS